MTDNETHCWPNSPERPPPIGRLIVVSGPSGVGKSTVTDALEEQGTFYFSISVTTRQPRPGEEDGEHYRFVSDEEFGEMIEADELLEWAKYNQNLYGTPRRPVLDQIAAGSDVLLEIEVQGAIQIIDAYEDAVTIFINPPSIEELVRRLRTRGHMSEETIERRMEIARGEMEIGRQRFDHRVINDDLERVVGEILGILHGSRPK